MRAIRLLAVLFSVFSSQMRAIRLLAVLFSVFSSQMQALSQGLWVLCAEMGVAWHILGAGEVSEP